MKLRARQNGTPQPTPGRPKRCRTARQSERISGVEAERLRGRPCSLATPPLHSGRQRPSSTRQISRRFHQGCPQLLGRIAARSASAPVSERYVDTRDGPPFEVGDVRARANTSPGRQCTISAISLHIVPDENTALLPGGRTRSLVSGSAKFVVTYHRTHHRLSASGVSACRCTG